MMSINLVILYSWRSCTVYFVLCRYIVSVVKRVYVFEALIWQPFRRHYDGLSFTQI